MATRNRLFSAFHLPSGLHLVVLGAIVLLLLVLLRFPVEKIHAVFSQGLWSHPQVDSLRASQGMLWLIFANVVSFLSVMLLLVELFLLQRSVSGQQFELDEARARRRFPKMKEESLNAVKAMPDEWATRPLLVTFIISVCVLLAMVSGVLLTLFRFFPNVTHDLLVGLTLLTGVGYLGAMTLGDLFAQRTYRRCTCLRLTWNAGTHPDQIKERTRRFDNLVDALAEYSSIIRFVDFPILASLVVVTVYELSRLGTDDGFHLGFATGAVAMHVIIANLISLIILCVRTTVDVDEV